MTAKTLSDPCSGWDLLSPHFQATGMMITAIVAPIWEGPKSPHGLHCCEVTFDGSLMNIHDQWIFNSHWQSVSWGPIRLISSHSSRACWVPAKCQVDDTCIVAVNSKLESARLPSQSLPVVASWTRRCGPSHFSSIICKTEITGDLPQRLAGLHLVWHEHPVYASPPEVFPKHPLRMTSGFLFYPASSPLVLASF